MDGEIDDFEFKAEVKFELHCFYCQETFEIERDLLDHLIYCFGTDRSSSSDSARLKIQEVDGDVMINDQTKSSKETGSSWDVVEKQAQHRNSKTVRAEDQHSGDLTIEQELKFKNIYCPKCEVFEKFFAFQTEFRKHQDCLKISLSHFDNPDTQAQIRETTNNEHFEKNVRDGNMTSQISEDNQLEASTQTEQAKNSNPVRAFCNSKNRNLSETEESNVKENEDMDSSDDFGSDDEFKLEFKCLTCHGILTNEKDLWEHVKFHKKLSKLSKKFILQNQMDNEKLDLLKRQEEAKSKPTQIQKIKNRKRKNDSNDGSSEKFKKQSGQKNKKSKQSEKTTQNQGAHKTQLIFLLLPLLKN